MNYCHVFQDSLQRPDPHKSEQIKWCFGRYSSRFHLFIRTILCIPDVQRVPLLGRLRQTHFRLYHPNISSFNSLEQLHQPHFVQRFHQKFLSYPSTHISGSANWEPRNWASCRGARTRLSDYTQGLLWCAVCPKRRHHRTANSKTTVWYNQRADLSHSRIKRVLGFKFDEYTQKMSLILRMLKIVIFAVSFAVIQKSLLFYIFSIYSMSTFFAVYCPIQKKNIITNFKIAKLIGVYKLPNHSIFITPTDWVSYTFGTWKLMPS